MNDKAHLAQTSYDTDTGPCQTHLRQTTALSFALGGSRGKRGVRGGGKPTISR